MANLGSEAHILVFPYPAQGHLLPLLDLTHNLCSHGFTITILITPKNLPLLNPLLSSHPSIQTLLLPFPAHPSIPPGVENVKDLPAHSSPAVMICALGQLYHPLLNWFKSHSSPPVAIISDMFLGWTHHLASTLNIRSLVFSPSGALALSVIYSVWHDMPEIKENDVVSFSRLPNCLKYPWWQVSPMYRSYVKGDPNSEFLKDSFRANFTSWGLVVNSFTELEGLYLDHFRRELGHDRVWAVGPTFLTQGSITEERGGPNSIPLDRIVTWLDNCEENKVVYICFGSQTSLTNNQMEEIASSLEISGVNFVWCVKKTEENKKYNKIPSGFEDRVAGRGLVIRGWAPQVTILSHKGIGAFLTHCGWNSSLEALIAGVPMIAWPMGADQFSNATLLVDELGVAVRACEGVNTVPNSVELANTLMESVKDNRVRKERAQKISKHALNAVKNNGSSTKDFDKLVHNLISLKENDLLIPN
ncbi:UDP-glycosyltransferase 89B2 [Euphorbia lathyris]|uniref:UDP-glycosyltransferase 89B2 n=1 Tax=Euphorbia lathyris TaxID=212925 RepID=UPI00331407CB